MLPLHHPRRSSKGAVQSRRRHTLNLDGDNAKAVVQDLDENTASVVSQFRTFQKELDEKHDKYERILKKGRDVTIESKRIIFLLHRITSSGAESGVILEDAGQRLEELRNCYLHAIAEELEGEDPYMYLRAFSPGIQEYIEAAAFYYYLKKRQLIPLKEIQNELIFPKHSMASSENAAKQTVTLFIPPSEYILGIADLTGEVMRKCIYTVCAGDVEFPFELRAFMRNILEGFVLVGNSGPREVNHKLTTLRQSVDKVENACYAMKVRRTEIPDYKMNDVLLIQQNSERERDEESADF